MNNIASLIALSIVLSFASPPARAFIGPPSLVPPNPIAGQLVSVAVMSGVCDIFIEGPTPITRSGNDIRIVLPTVYAFDPEFCFYPVGTAVYPVAALDAGAYTLQVDRTYLDANGYIIEPIGTLAFTVLPQPSVPMLDVASMMLLGIALLIAALCSRRARQFLPVLAITVGMAMPLAARSQTPPPTYALQVLLSAKPGALAPEVLHKALSLNAFDCQ